MNHTLDSLRYPFILLTLVDTEQFISAISVYCLKTFSYFKFYYPKNQVPVPLTYRYPAIHKHTQSQGTQGITKEGTQYSQLLCTKSLCELFVFALYTEFLLSLDECWAPVRTQRHMFVLITSLVTPSGQDFLLRFPCFMLNFLPI